MGLVAPRHVGSSRTRAPTHVPCIGRQILNHCTTREVPPSLVYLFFNIIIMSTLLQCVFPGKSTFPNHFCLICLNCYSCCYSLFTYQVPHSDIQPSTIRPWYSFVSSPTTCPLLSFAWFKFYFLLFPEHCAYLSPCLKVLYTVLYIFIYYPTQLFLSVRTRNFPCPKHNLFSNLAFFKAHLKCSLL